MTNFQTTNAVILSYLPFAGGKFLSNCLALSKHACPQDLSAAEYLLRSPDDYDFRLKTVLRSLPPKDQLTLWKNFEFGDHNLFGRAVDSWWNGYPKESNDITQQLSHSGMKFFVVNHSMDAGNLLKVWKQATIIRLINFRKFQDLSISIKNQSVPQDRSSISGNYCQEKYELLRGPDWPDWWDFEHHGYDASKIDDLDIAVQQEISTFYRLHYMKNQVLLFDVDRCYLDQEQFMPAVKELYQQLEFTDFRPELVESFYKKYIELHI
jgi:hypothetical protein